MDSYTDTTTLREYKTTLARFKQYYDGKTANSERFLENPNLNKRYNVISLEFSKTNLVKFVKPPLALRESSWTNLWPSEENGWVKFLNIYDALRVLGVDLFVV